MGFLDRFRGQPQIPDVQVLTKKPGFAITQFTTNNPFTNLIQQENNYYEQYILYVSKCVDYISDKVASANIMLVDRNEQAIDNDLWQDLSNFNPYMTLWEARKLREMHLYLTGAAFWYIDRDPIENKKAEFYPLDPTHMQINTGQAGLPTSYQYTDADGRLITLPLEDVIYFRRMNPQNWFEGQSALKNITFWTNAYAQGAQYNMNKLGNNTNVDKFIYFAGIGEDEQQRIETSLRNKYQGSKNAGRTGVVGVEPKVIDVSSNQKDLDYVEGMKMLRQDILAYFGIPEALLFPSATNANSKEAVRTFQADTLEPAMRKEQAVLNEQLIKKYDKIKSDAMFIFPSVVDQDKNELVAQAKQLVDAGIFTRDQALQYIGEEPVGGELGGEYLKGAAPKQAEVDPAMADELKQLDEKSKSLGEYLNKLLEEKEEAEFRQKSEMLADEQEGIIYAAAEGLFKGQFDRAKQYIEKTDKVTVRGIFNYKEEVEITKQTFKTVYAKVISNSNVIANTEIKQKLFANKSPHVTNYREKALSPEAIADITKKLSYFSDEINETSQKKLRKIIKQGIDSGFDKSQLVAAIQDVFDGYIDGVDNITVLEQLGVYNSSITSTDDRYKKMLAEIDAKFEAGEITKGQKESGYKALRGLIDPASPIGKLVDAALDKAGVNRDAGIKRSRAVTIARTEATYARNLGFEDTYSNNPFIKGKRWKAASDSDTRDTHRALNNTTVGIDEPFVTLDGDKLKFPGDTSLGAQADEIVNCRCRITSVVID